MPLPSFRLSRPWLAVAAVAVTAALALGGLAFMGTGAQVVEVVQGDLAVTVAATGRVIAASRVEAGAQGAGVVAAVPVQEGDRVPGGAVLASLRDDEARAASAQARAALAEAQARAEQLRASASPVAEQQLRQTEVNRQAVRREHTRVAQLHRQGFYSEASMDEAQRALDTAEAQYRGALAQAEAARPKGAEAHLVAARLQQARAALALAEAKLEYTQVRAPAAGRVLRRGAEPGDLVRAGDKLFTLAVGEPQVQLNVDEKNLALLAPGLRARVSSDAFPSQAFDAEVLTVAPAVDPQRGTVEVKLRVPAPPEFLRTDMTVSGEIAVATRRQALLLPAEAVREASGGAPWVLALRDGHARRTALRLGARGVGSVEILEGLRAGDLVVPPSEARVREGTRVRAQR
ncbi:MAG: efflux RND transporter periplasmic adaptor subunit [Betaproteobacteria bacterium]